TSFWLEHSNTASKQMDGKWTIFLRRMRPMQASLLNGLNANQQQAVTSTSKTILCLAGAGSGKTAVLTRRIAHLFDNRVGTSNMLALTFTRLAGAEMKERVIKLIGEQEGKKLFCNTFHA